MKIALKLAYLGQNYHGLQKQPGLVTIDSEVRKALARIGVINGDFCYAGRTDRGVSALCQVIDFYIDEDKAYLARPRCVNGRMPRDIWAWAWAVAPIGFSARWNAIWREYRYNLYNEKLDLDAMRSAASMLLGQHDFRNFSSAKEDTVREILKLDISGQGDIFTIDVRARGFLWNMVRKIACTLEMIGSGERDLGWIEDLLNPELNYGAPTAPPEGLILMDVGYEPALEWHLDEYSMDRAAKALMPVVKRQMALAWAEKSLFDAMKP